MQEDYSKTELFRQECLNADELTFEDKLKIRGALTDGWLVRFLGILAGQVEMNLSICQNIDYAEMPKANITAAQVQGRTSALYFVMDTVLEFSEATNKDDEENGS